MAMYIGMPLVIVLYMLTNVSYLTVMDVPTLVNSPAVAMVIKQRAITLYLRFILETPP